MCCCRVYALCCRALSFRWCDWTNVSISMVIKHTYEYKQVFWIHTIFPGLNHHQYFKPWLISKLNDQCWKMKKQQKIAMRTFVYFVTCKFQFSLLFRQFSFDYDGNFWMSQRANGWYRVKSRPSPRHVFDLCSGWAQKLCTYCTHCDQMFQPLLLHIGSLRFPKIQSTLLWIALMHLISTHILAHWTLLTIVRQF